MNKKLIALAIASAVSMPAFADSSVNIYGTLNVSANSATNVNSSSGNQLNSTTNNVGGLSDNGSYFGLKGSEDLGNGLSGIWQIEQGVSVVGEQGVNVHGSGSTNSVFGANPYNNQRNTFVGLSNTSAGTVLAGIHDTPYKMSTASMDPFADTLGDYNGIVGSSSQASNTSLGGALGLGNESTSASNYFDLRPSNVVVYVSPNMSGLTVVGAYVFGNATNTNPTGNSQNNTNGQSVANNSSGDAYSIAAMYNAGPLYLTAAYERHDFGGFDPSTGNGNGSLSVGNPYSTTNLTGESNQAYKLGASYSIMDTTLAVLYEDSSDNFGTNGSNLLGHNTWYVSAKHAMGAWDVMAAFAAAGNDNSKAATGIAGDTGADQWSIGGDYNFSKNTSLYALYTQIANNRGAFYNFADTTSPVAEANGGVAGATISALSLGLKHSF